LVRKIAIVFARSIALVAVIAAAHLFAAEAELGRPFDVKPAETVTIQGLRITFEGVSEDSRCPTGAQCMWAGDAAATFTTAATSGKRRRTVSSSGSRTSSPTRKKAPRSHQTITAQRWS
jgi:hypothetical protein